MELRFIGYPLVKVVWRVYKDEEMDENLQYVKYWMQFIAISSILYSRGRIKEREVLLIGIVW